MLKLARGFVALLLSIIAISSAHAHDVEAAYMQSFTAYLAKANKQVAEIWPTLDLKRPLVIGFLMVDDEDTTIDDRLYAMNSNLKNPAWQHLTMNNMAVDYLPHDTLNMHQFNPSMRQPFFNLEGNNAIPMMIYVSHNDDGGMNLVQHAATVLTYYIYQELITAPNLPEKIRIALQTRVIHSGFLHNEAMSLLRLQTAILRSYVNHPDNDKLKDFLAVHAIRNKLLDNNSLQFEANHHHGLCVYYVFYKSLLGVKDPLFWLFNEDFTYLSNPEMNYSDDLEIQFTAAAIALDALKPTWKTEFMATPAKTTIDMLAAQYPMSDTENKSRLEKAKQQYGYAKIAAAVDEVLTPYIAATKAAAKVYAANDGILFTLTAPAMSHINSDVQNLQSDSSKHFMQASSDQSESHFNSVGMDLTVKNVPVFVYEYLFANDAEKTGYSRVSLKLNGKWQISLDNGEKDTLAHFVAKSQARQFSQLQIASEDGVTNIALKATGAIKVVDGRLVFDQTMLSSRKVPEALVRDPFTIIKEFSLKTMVGAKKSQE